MSDQDTDQLSECIALKDAAKLLGISPGRMSQIVSEGGFTWETTPLDKRMKLLRRADVMAAGRKIGRLPEQRATAAAVQS